MSERVLFETSDGVEIVGVHRQAQGAKGTALLLHMMPATKESWDAFADGLLRHGLSSLAIDLRGHGESVRQGTRRLEYMVFEDPEHGKTALDVDAAVAWLFGRGVPPERLAAVGASIGANLSLRLAAARPELHAVMALSPGLNYRGLTTDDAIGALREWQSVCLAASEEDAYAYASVLELEKTATAAARTVRRLRGAGHGTTMFERQPAFMHECLLWLSGRFSAS